MFQRALICTDFSDGVYRLAQFVPSLAAGGFRQLVFFHNLSVERGREIPRSNPEQVETTRKQLTDLLRDVPAEVNVKVEVQVGRASDNILRLAKTTKSDVIILGTPTRTLLEEKLFGSTTMQMAERTEVPLLILRPQLISTYTTEELDLRCRHLFRYLLIPYEGSAGGDYLLQQIKQQVQSNPHSVLERIRLLWVVDDSVRRELRGDQPKQAAQAKLEQVQKDLAALDLVVNTSVVEGDPLQEILAAAETHDIGAIATCSRNLGGVMKWTVPSVTRELVRNSWHPLLFYPSAR
ncbi:universal stress protein [Pseudanabaena sp. FACHB-2040]|uniref:universal stress protein n=1 Tax=Pseudanabaena sp. FACHB-2040 TaxID=2692859 RepID=UPI001683B444|nr:universal stress protein [Pseudanabaena sp. FACHB-2040]MBD2257353.1 universal stress protein [Pseudanabaena sp. FACHB-2040]